MVPLAEAGLATAKGNDVNDVPADTRSCQRVWSIPNTPPFKPSPAIIRIRARFSCMGAKLLSR
eukprot:3114159-Prorocentrum_lima.AAC.1